MLNTALPGIARATLADNTQLLWIVNSYGLMFAALLLPAGAAGDLFGRRRLLLGGLALFAASNAAACFAESPSLLIGLRALAGAGAAAITPTTLAILVDVHAPSERGRVYVVWSGVIGAGGIAGLLVAGALLEAWPWQSVVVLNAVVGALVLAACALVVPRAQAGGEPRADPLGAALSALGLAALVFGVIEAPGWGWTDVRVLLCVAIGLELLVAFVVWELRRERPMLDVRLFRRPEFGSGSLAVALQWFVTLGAFLLLLQFLQLVRGLSPLEAGVALLAPAVALGVCSPLAERGAVAIGRAPVAAIGMVVCGAGLGAVALTTVDTPFWVLVVALLPFGAGIGITSVPATAMIMDDSPSGGQGMASAVNDVTREVGGALGIAVFGSVVNDRYAAGLPAGVPAAVRRSLAEALALGDPATSHLAVGAFMDGFSLALMVGAGTLVAAAVAVTLWGR
jgi:EmrB/QacA subfamily drug resistance transporter